jgi:hypothetical protein
MGKSLALNALFGRFFLDIGGLLYRGTHANGLCSGARGESRRHARVLTPSTMHAASSSRTRRESTRCRKRPEKHVGCTQWVKEMRNTKGVLFELTSLR